MIKKNEIIQYYSISDTLSLYSDRVLMYMIIGARGVGKTYSTKSLLLNRWLKAGERFFYLRRYAEDISTAKRGFFSKAVRDKPEWKKYEFREVGDPIGEFQMRERVPDDGDGMPVKNNHKWQTIGYYAPLSMFNRIKSQEYDNVKKVMYDEFLIEPDSNQRYLKNEPKQLLNVYDSIARDDDKVKLILLANATSIYNPMFEEFGIVPDSFSEYALYKDDSILVHMPPNKARDMNDGSGFSRLIKGTSYEEYAVDNKFSNNTKEFISELPGHAKFKWSIIVEGVKYGVWSDETARIFIISDQYNDTGVTLSLSWEDAASADYTSPKARAYTRLISHTKNNHLYFTSPAIREKFRGPINSLIAGTNKM